MPGGLRGSACPGAETCHAAGDVNPGAYGRIVRIKITEQDRRILVPTPHGSPSWHRGYNRRSALERINNRIDNIFGFEHHFIRGMLLRPALFWTLRPELFRGETRRKSHAAAGRTGSGDRVGQAAYRGRGALGGKRQGSSGIDGGTKPWNLPIECKLPCFQHQIERQSDKVELREYLFRLYALLSAGLPAGRWRSHSSVWQAQRGSCWFGRLRGYVSGPTLGFDEGGKEFALGALHGLCGGQVGL